MPSLPIATKVVVVERREVNLEQQQQQLLLVIRRWYLLPFLHPFAPRGGKKSMDIV